MASYGIFAAVAAGIALLTFGIPLFLAEYFPWRSLYNQRHGRPTVTTKSYKGRTALITGANGAFGSRAAKIFAQRDVNTLVLVDVFDCTGVKQAIETELGEAGKSIPEILIWKIDMMSYEGCREVGRKAKELTSLDHVLLTAGILSFNRRESPEGWETCKPKLMKSYLLSDTTHSDTSQLSLIRAHRPPTTPRPEIIPHKPLTTSPHLRHHLWHIPLLLHHVRPQNRLLSQKTQQQQGRHGTSPPIRPLQRTPSLLFPRARCTNF
jgi:hypothetical protein